MRSARESRRIIGAGLVVWALLGAAPCRAEVVDIPATGRYHLGDNDTKLDGHRLALMEAKRNALEKAGTYVESITEVKDYQLTRDDVRSYTAGIVEVTETSEPKWQMEGGNLTVTVTVSARVDKDDVAKRIAALHTNKEATQQLRDAHAKARENERKVAALNKQLKKAKKGSPAAERARASRDNALAGVDAATLHAQGVAAANFSRESWDKMRGYVNNNVNLRGCLPFKSSAQAAAADRDGGLLFVGVPAVALVLSRPRKRRTGRREPGQGD